MDGKEDIELDVIGFEYGLCDKIDIVGDLITLELYYLPKRGVHKIVITDTENTHSFPESTSRKQKDMEHTVLRFADGINRPLGLNGRWKN